MQCQWGFDSHCGLSAHYLRLCTTGKPCLGRTAALSQICLWRTSYILLHGWVLNSWEPSTLTLQCDASGTFKPADISLRTCDPVTCGTVPGLAFATTGLSQAHRLELAWTSGRFAWRRRKSVIRALTTSPATYEHHMVL